MLFSATISPEVDALARRALNATPPSNRPPRAPPRHRARDRRVDKLQKKGALARFQANRPSTLIFTRTSMGGQARTFPSAKASANALHGDKAQSQRQRTLDQFRSGGRNRATDIAPRIDVEGIRMVGTRRSQTPRSTSTVGAPLARRGVSRSRDFPDECSDGDVERLIGQNFPRK